MSLESVWHGWQAEVARLLPAMPVKQRRVLALFSLGVGVAHHCALSRAAAALPGRVKVPSRERRFRRFVSNPRVDVTAQRQRIAAAMLRGAAGTTIWLAVDETHQGTTPTGAALAVLAVRLLYRGRAVPLTWACHRPGEQSAAYPTLIAGLLAEVAALLPAEARVVLLADRGLSWPSLIRCCQTLGWSFLLRVTGQAQLLTADGRERPLRDLLTAPGMHWLGAGNVFRDAGWLPCNVVAVWRRAREQRWLLLTDLDPTRRRTAEYRRRMWEEESFRDDKSSGFHWEQSRITDPDHADRLLLVLQLAMCFVLSQGSQVLKRGWRTFFERRDRRELSVFTLGLRWIQSALVRDTPLQPRLVLYLR
jgi:hypothetical protein